jgi:peptidoglycan/LPS O-acetylase OafA/YrhL
MKVGQSRNFGLDVVRATAIVLVLIGHAELVGQTHRESLFYGMGFYGVEIFFVLSGFLIGQIFIRELTQSLTLQTIKTFWIRRWFRTLPLFFIVIFLRELLFNDTGSFHYLHWMFLHTTMRPEGYDAIWFMESWSLAVEEWFYLLLPLFSLVLIHKHKKLVIAFFLFFFVVAILLRYLYWIRSGNPVDYNIDMRMFPFLRLDSLMFGVLLAFIKLNFRAWYNKISAPWVFVFSLGTLILLLAFTNNILVYDFKGVKTIPGTIGLSLNSLFILFMIPFLEQSEIPERIANKLYLIKPIYFTSLFSYCLYLIHVPIYESLVGAKESIIDLWWILKLGGAWVLMYSVGALSYFYFETPILRYRDKLTLRGK